jgi:hypothetical protein
MTLTFRSSRLTWIFATIAMIGAGCGSGGSGTPGAGGAASGTGGGSGAAGTTGGAGTTGAAGTTGGAGTTGAAGAGGSAAGTMGPGAGGAPGGRGGASGGRGGSGGGGRGGGSGGPTDGGATGGDSGACVPGSFPTADPSKAGPFAVTTENNVGPPAGVGTDGGAPPTFTLVRPTDLRQGGLCHPVITWGNGHGTTPSLYARLLNQLASHGFVVIASNSSQVSMGDPPPMLVGVTWVIEQNSDPTSVLYQRIDTSHIGASGHSEGALSTMRAGADARIVTIAPIEGSMATKTLHGPALLMCGGMDTTLPCDGHVTSFNGITNQPVMLADQLAATHTSWVGGGGGAGGTLNPFIVALTGWMRVQLMGDSALRSMFYGASCTLCQDTATWQVMQKMLD